MRMFSGPRQPGRADRPRPRSRPGAPPRAAAVLAALLLAGGLPGAAAAPDQEGWQAAHAITRMVRGSIPAMLSVPVDADPTQPGPLVILMSDASGADLRLELYARRLLSLGVAVIEADFGDSWAEDGSRGDTVPVPLAERLGLVIAGLAAEPGIDPRRIAAIGLGRGARAVLLAAAADRPLAAAALLYPGCDATLDAAARHGATGLAGAAVLLLHGDADPANPGDACGTLAASLGGPASRVSHRVLRGATYAWDQPANGAPGSGTTLLPDPSDPTSRLRAEPDPVRAQIALDRVLGLLMPILTPPTER